MIRSISNKIKENRLYTFLFRSFVVVAAIIILDALVGAGLRTLYFSQSHQSDYMTTYVMEENRAEFLVFGASSANHHYKPESFDSIGMTFRNCGRDGNFILYHYAILQATLKRYKPKLIILDITEEDFYEAPDTYDRLSSLLPYYKTHPEVREVVELRGRFEKVKLLSRIYPFNSEVISSMTGTLDINNKRDEEALQKGYVPLFSDWHKPLGIMLDEKKEFDDTKTDYFRKFIADCKEAGIKLVIVVSPSYRKIEYKRKYIKLVEEVAGENGIPFWNYTNSEPYLSTPGYFADIVHLNDKGAGVFSDMIAKRIQEEIIFLPE